MSPSEKHVPDDLLAGAAAGEELPAEHAQHVEICNECRERLDEWLRLVGTAHSLSAEDVPSEAPSRVWAMFTMPAKCGFC